MAAADKPNNKDIAAESKVSFIVSPLGSFLVTPAFAGRESRPCAERSPRVEGFQSPRKNLQDDE